MRILGVDPGTLKVGFGVIEEIGGERILVASGTIKAARSASIEQRLKTIYDGLSVVIHQHNPDQVAVEGIFVAKNVASTVRIGEGRAVAMLAAANAGLPVVEYSPREVKKAVVGQGGAHKTQVAAMVRAALRLEEEPQPDEADAIAIGIAHLNRGPVRQAKAAIEGNAK